jgi:hypothetical protein
MPRVLLPARGAAEVRERSSRMQILIITFKLVGLDDAAYRQHATALAPRFLQVPGLLSKTWLADEARHTYGGIYLFQDEASRQQYLESDIVRDMQANPLFAEVSVRTFGTVEAATAITGGTLVERWVLA